MAAVIVRGQTWQAEGCLLGGRGVAAMGSVPGGQNASLHALMLAPEDVLCPPNSFSPIPILRCAWQETEFSMRQACEVYRPVAVRCTLVYLLMDSLHLLDRVYWYSLAIFIQVSQR